MGHMSMLARSACPPCLGRHPTLSHAFLNVRATSARSQVKGKGLMQTMLWVPNSLKPELLELELDGAHMRTLRKVLTNNSFRSTHSRVTVSWHLARLAYSRQVVGQ